MHYANKNSGETHGEDKFVLVMEGLYIEMAGLKLPGEWLDKSGWTDALIKASIKLTSSGWADAIVNVNTLQYTGIYIR